MHSKLVTVVSNHMPHNEKGNAVAINQAFDSKARLFIRHGPLLNRYDQEQCGCSIIVVIHKT